MGVTLKEIAALAGVHRSTVDKVLHKRPGVSDAVRRRVQAVLEEQDYRPNPVGRALQKQSAVIRLAAVLLEVDALPFIVQGMRQAAETLHMHNVEIDFTSSPFGDVDAQVRLIGQAIDRAVQGIVVSPIAAEPVRQALRRAEASGIPVICTNTDIDGAGRLCYVGENAAKAGRIAGRMMGEFLHGAGEIAVITSKRSMTNNNYFLHVREVEFLAYLRANYPEIAIKEHVEGYENPATTYQITYDMLERQPELSGVYIVGGGVREVGRAICAAGRSGQLRVVCFEDYPEILDLVRGGTVTCTINSSTVRQGELPVHILIDYLMQDVRPENHVYTPCEILLRESLADEEEQHP